MEREGWASKEQGARERRGGEGTGLGKDKRTDRARTSKLQGGKVKGGKGRDRHRKPGKGKRTSSVTGSKCSIHICVPTRACGIGRRDLTCACHTSRCSLGTVTYSASNIENSRLGRC
jgi:hypothetical protein